jgi:uncharacterized Zn finger protein
MYGTKKAPPANGIKVSATGMTWWGQRWISALESVLAGDSGRLARGRTYARAGRTHDLEVNAGAVTAKVTGSSDSPYKIRIRLSNLSDTAWESAITEMASKAQFTAELLGGEMPREIDVAFQAAKTSLFPRKRSELTTSCSCPDHGDPCKHIAATHYVLGEVLDRDPFMLFEMRGRTKAQVLDALRALRGKGGGAVAHSTAKSQAASAGAASAGAASAGAASDAEPPEIPRMTPGKFTAAEYDRPREAMPSLRFSFDEKVAHGAVLRQLGAPAAWGGKKSPADALSPLVQRAAETARRIALSDRDDAAPETAATKRSAVTTTKSEAAATKSDATTKSAVTTTKGAVTTTKSDATTTKSGATTSKRRQSSTKRDTTSSKTGAATLKARTKRIVAEKTRDAASSAKSDVKAKRVVPPTTATPRAPTPDRKRRSKRR